jgi:hypothetical protein
MGDENYAPAALFLRERPGTHCAGRFVASGLLCNGTECLALAGVQTADRPTRSESLHRLGSPGRHCVPLCTVARAVKTMCTCCRKIFECYSNPQFQPFYLGLYE